MRDRIMEKFGAFWRKSGHRFGCLADEFREKSPEAHAKLRRNIMSAGYRAGYEAGKRATVGKAESR